MARNYTDHVRRRLERSLRGHARVASRRRLNQLRIFLLVHRREVVICEVG